MAAVRTARALGRAAGMGVTAPTGAGFVAPAEYFARAAAPGKARVASRPAAGVGCTVADCGQTAAVSRPADSLYEAMPNPSDAASAVETDDATMARDGSRLPIRLMAASALTATSLIALDGFMSADRTGDPVNASRWLFDGAIHFGDTTHTTLNFHGIGGWSAPVGTGYSPWRPDPCRDSHCAFDPPGNPNGGANGSPNGPGDGSNGPPNNPPGNGGSNGWNNNNGGGDGSHGNDGPPGAPPSGNGANNPPVVTTTATPEPSSVLLLATGLALIACWQFRRRRALATQTAP